MAGLKQSFLFLVIMGRYAKKYGPIKQNKDRPSFKQTRQL